MLSSLFSFFSSFRRSSSVVGGQMGLYRSQGELTGGGVCGGVGCFIWRGQTLVCRLCMYQKCTSIYTMCVCCDNRASSKEKRLSMDALEFFHFFVFVQVNGQGRAGFLSRTGGTIVGTHIQRKHARLVLMCYLVLIVDSYTYPACR